MAKRIKLPKRIRNELRGLNHRVDLGSRHYRIFVNDRLAGITPRGIKGDGETNGNGLDNVLAQIRRLK